MIAWRAYHAHEWRAGSVWAGVVIHLDPFVLLAGRQLVNMLLEGRAHPIVVNNSRIIAPEQSILAAEAQITGYLGKERHPTSKINISLLSAQRYFWVYDLPPAI
jgi:hypothetical protein